MISMIKCYFLVLAGRYNPRCPINLRPPPRHSPPRNTFRQNSEASQQGRDRDLEQERCGEPQGRGDVPRVAGLGYSAVTAVGDTFPRPVKIQIRDKGG